MKTARKIFASLAAATVMVGIVGQRGMGGMLWLVALPLFGWMLYSIYAIMMIPEIRTQQLARF